MNKYKQLDDELRRLETLVTNGYNATAKTEINKFLYQTICAIDGIPTGVLGRAAETFLGAPKQIPIRDGRTSAALERRVNKAQALLEKAHGHPV